MFRINRIERVMAEWLAHVLTNPVSVGLIPNIVDSFSFCADDKPRY